MRAALLCNRNAGNPISEAALVSALGAAGWSIACHVDEDQLDARLVGRVDAVVVAGGDGTVGAAARRLVGSALPMIILPAGTSNNVARSLGLGVDPEQTAARLDRVVERWMDLGIVRTEAHGPSYFLEGVSSGVLARVLGEEASHEHKETTKATRLIADALSRYEPRRFEIEADGRDLSGDYLLVAAMNVRSLGPALELAPGARIDDGELDLVCVGPELEGALARALHRAEDRTEIVVPGLEPHRVTSARIRSDEPWAHRDDDPWQPGGTMSIAIAAGAVRILVPYASV